ncbi:YbfB/YjiJ family MFS transporter [Bradyrhizobium sp. LHD-71]|uniref:YbfB/YjiJ family MFS transporter n=1 Tax=Bradyrhizobium sp. LHD-71 TaxID=3072141 RepID=UPI00280C8E20|nr:YbfB/YjiJ family MFS transporter [Bradyrhizobium sp. LHD-71]MDQ8729625.1 YbfB/YjiJ family MFS transporter [Bradyrhizobium sp. LHD-71]
MDSSRPESPEQRAARLILVLALAPAVGVGLCRFAYSLVLPDMRESLAWSYATAGFLNTVNAAGYLSGALAASLIARRIGLFRAVLIATAICVVTLVLSMVPNMLVLSTARVISGFAGAVAFVAASALATNIAQAHPARLGFLTGLLYTGPGIGIFISGLTAPFLLEWLGPGSWWIVWGVLAAIALALTVVLPLARTAPDNSVKLGGAANAPLSPMLVYLIGYFLSGAGSIAYMTFMIAFVRDAGGGAVTQSAFWTIIALGSFISPWLWGRVIGVSRAGGATAIVNAVTSVGALIPFFASSPAALVMSAAIFGSAFFAVTSSTTAFVRFNYPPQAWPKAIGILTMAFGVGSMLGPIVTGAVTDATGNLSHMLVVSSAMLALGAIVAACQRPLVVREKA